MKTPPPCTAQHLLIMLSLAIFRQFCQNVRPTYQGSYRVEASACHQLRVALVEIQDMRCGCSSHSISGTALVTMISSVSWSRADVQKYIFNC